MKRFRVLTSVAILLVCAVALGNPPVTLTLTSTENGQMVPRGTTIDWTIKVIVPNDGNSAGLALVCVDFVQNGTNPAFLDVSPAGAVPADMVNFSRPAGISNPGEGGATTGYVGVQRSPAGQTYKNLIQIGGGQNTFGAAMPPGTGIGESATVVAGVGQAPGGRMVASGSFQAPGMPGLYVFRLEQALVNVLQPINPPPVPPGFWPVAQATIVNLPAATISFTIGTGDLNCDGVITFDDINPFVDALSDPAFYQQQYPNCNILYADCNHDGVVDFNDINPFVDLLSGG